MYPENYRITSDLATINSTGKAVATLTLPGSLFVASSGTYIVSQDVALSGSGQLRLNISSSKIAGINYPCTSLAVERSWSTTAVEVFITVWRLSSTTVRAQLSIFNGFMSGATAPAGDEVFTVQIRAMGLPF